MSCLEIGTIHIDHVDVLNITADCDESSTEKSEPKESTEEKVEESKVDTKESNDKSK